jgi:hypothetical protein
MPIINTQIRQICLFILSQRGLRPPDPVQGRGRPKPFLSVFRPCQDVSVPAGRGRTFRGMARNLSKTGLAKLCLENFEGALNEKHGIDWRCYNGVSIA